MLSSKRGNSLIFGLIIYLSVISTNSLSGPCFLINIISTFEIEDSGVFIS